MKKIIYFLSAMFFSVTLYAQAGTLDSEFAMNGALLTTLGLGETAQSTVSAIDVTPSGKIIIAGGAGSDLVLARLKTDGSIDETFGNGGKAELDLNFDYNFLDDIVIQQDGKIVVLGNSVFYGGNNPTMWIMRYNPEGSLDINFGQSGSPGYMAAGAVSTIYRPEAVLVQDDGKIVLAGYYHSGGWTGFVARFLESGAPDLSFGDNNGFQDVTFNLSGHKFINALSILPDGKFIAGGTQIIKLNQNGTVDNSFGNSGLVDPGFRISSLAIQMDGKILATRFGSPEYEAKVNRYLPNGMLDNTYGVGGSTVVSSSTYKMNINASVPQPDNKLILVGAASAEGQLSFEPDRIALIRFNSDGILDNGFGNGGIVVSDNNTMRTEELLCTTLQIDGKIITAGYVSKQVGSDFAVFRYLSGLDVGTIDFSNSTNQVFIYPNLATDYLNFQLRGAVSSKGGQFRILDVAGKVVRSFGAGQLGDTFILPIWDWAAGAYVLQYVDGGNGVVVSEKFIKL